VAALLVGLSTFGAEERALPIPGVAANTNNAADILWLGMHEAGMIDAEQFLYVQENGCLPGGSTVEGSPVAAESQLNWNQLAQQEVITSDELAAMLFDGDIPGLTEEEERAFEALAPVYRPNRAKRLTYEVRRKHARVELIRMAHRFREEHEARTANLEERAAALGFPLERGEAVLVGIDENDQPLYIVSDGIGACDTISADEVWTTNAVGNINTNFNLSGAGITLAMWEEGRANKNHQEFGGRITYMTARDFFDHAHAVAAIMIGAGVKTNAQGVAPQATLHAYSWEDDFKTDLMEVAGNGLIRFSNHSYHLAEVQKGGLVTDISTNRDDIVYKTYYHLPVMTVSNDGDGIKYQTMANGVAKNVLSVGAVDEIPGGYAGTTSVVLSTTSGWGPTADGRIKPDVVAGGWSGWIPLGSTNYNEVGTYGKTSFAAPAVTGGGALLQELYERFYGPDPTPLLASTWKALLIHTADEAGAYSGPDYCYGWGLVNVLSAAELIVEDAQLGGNHFMLEFTLLDGDSSYFQVASDGSGPLKITIAWTDPYGYTLINDLDLRITGPDGTVYYPYILNPTYGYRADAATTGDNSLDNVEQVVVTNTVAGLYTVKVAHKDTLANGGQAFSMILSASTNPDPTLHLSVSTNGLPLLTWEAKPGGAQAVMSSDDLQHSSHWVANSTQAILCVTNEWVDPAGFSDQARFYRIDKIQ
jgi:hypothetical protein